MTKIPIACELTAEAARDQLGEWRELFRAARSVTIDVTTGRVELPAGPEIVAAAADLARRERACCAFFRFLLEPVGDSLWLHVEVPPEAGSVLSDFLAVARPSG